MIVLAISTSTPRGSVALVRDGALVAESEYADLQGHAERLFEAIDAALARASIGRRDLDAVACDIGPGSFTGVRVGVASAKGIALALDAKLVGVTSLEAMAAAAFTRREASHDEIVVAAIDAKKNEIFLGAYRASGEVVVPPETRPLDRASFSLGDHLGDARAVIVGEVAASLPIEARVARGPAFDLPDAAWIGRIGAARLAAGADGDPELVEPLYVRAPDAMPMVALYAPAR